VVNRYQTFGEIASGGMATVEYGRLVGPHGFSRPVAIKRLHAHFAKDPAFAAMFIDEARLSARLLHANIIATLDVIERPGEIAIVMEYVHGEALSSVLEQVSARAEQVPIKIAAALVSSVLHGLHAAHETRNERDELLGVVHRDVSPQNILVGVDGVPRILDFGIAKAVDQLRATPNGEIKGKLAYIAPEQLRGQAVDRRADVFGAAAVLWETLTGFMLFHAENSSVLVQRVLQEPIKPPSAHVAGLAPELDAIVMRGLAREREQRYATAREMALELERKVGIATQSEVSDWLQQVAGAELAKRASLLRSLQERGGVGLSASDQGDPSQPGTRILDLNEVPSSEVMLQGSTPSIETRSRTTEVQSVWPWLVLGACLIAALVMLGLGWLRSDTRVRGRAASPVAVPELPAAQPAQPRHLPLPAAGAHATPVSSDALPSGLSPSAAEVPEGDERPPARRAQPKRAVRAVKPSSNAPEVKPAQTDEPPCSPVIYVNGIRRINPDCQRPVR
jgi:serine/threonine-protein kinase